MMGVKPNCAILAASLLVGSLLATTSLEAAVYELDASEPADLSGVLDLQVQGTFQFDDDGYANWNITTDDGEAFTFTPDNSFVVSEEEPSISFDNAQEFVFSDSLISSPSNLFLMSTFASDNDNLDTEWEAISLLFDEELGSASSVDVLPPSSLGSGFGNGFVIGANGDFRINNGVPISGTASIGDLTSVPVPGTALLLGIALLGLGAVGRRTA